MLKSILNLNGVTKLPKQQQITIKGGNAPKCDEYDGYVPCRHPETGQWSCEPDCNVFGK